MRLTLITGYREYFAPVPVPAAELAEALAVIDPAAFVPRIRWAVAPGEPGTEPVKAAGDGTPDLAFLFAADDDVEIDRRTALLLEYLQDVAPCDAHVFAALPVESLADAASGSPEPSEPRACRLLAAARRALGEPSVAWRRMALGADAHAVLVTLRARQGESSAGHGAGAEPWLLVAGHDDDGTLGTMRRNYLYAVLELAEALVSQRSILAGRGRAKHLCQLLEQNALGLRASVGPEHILAALEPGGELFELLARPLPSLLAGSAGSSLVPVRQRNHKASP